MLNFLGVGAQKAGTTWLYEMLSKHPDIYIPIKKEHHFWNNEYDGSNQQAYFSRFDRIGKCMGEITPAYGHLPVQVIADIRVLVPELRLIYIIRNPVERAWSAALMELARSGKGLNEVSEQWFVDQFFSTESLSRGNYEACLCNWLSFFPASQLLLLRYESLAREPDALLQTCCKHLGVRAFSRDELLRLDPWQRVFAGPRHVLPEGLKQQLLSIYQNQIRSLECYLRIDLSDWLS